MAEEENKEELEGLDEDGDLDDFDMDASEVKTGSLADIASATNMAQRNVLEAARNEAVAAQPQAEPAPTQSPPGQQESRALPQPPQPSAPSPPTPPPQGPPTPPPPPPQPQPKGQEQQEKQPQQQQQQQQQQQPQQQQQQPQGEKVEQERPKQVSSPATPATAMPTTVDKSAQDALFMRSYMTLPQPKDSDRPRPYVPCNPKELPPYYPQQPHPSLSRPETFENMSQDTLFYAFYFHKKTYQQYLAAVQLKRKSWRYHTRYNAWFKRKNKPIEANEEEEIGECVFFDFEAGWKEREKKDFTFKYKFLENELDVGRCPR